LQVWTTLAVLLPIGIIAAVTAIPKQQHDRLLQPTTVAALPVVVKTIETVNYIVSLRASQDRNSLQLEWNHKSAIAAPSALIYQLTTPAEDINNALLIGRIDAQGIFRFSIKKNTAVNAYHFILYDIIHHRKITAINF